MLVSLSALAILLKPVSTELCMTTSSSVILIDIRGLEIVESAVIVNVVVPVMT